MDATITTTKLDAARRQLRTALQLWFNDGDPIAIHTLVYAAHEIIHRLFRLKGLNDLLFDSILVQEDKRADFNRSLKEHANFIKHANREADPEASIDFPLHFNDLFLVISVGALNRMGERLEPIERALVAWHSLHQPDFFSTSEFKELMTIESVERLRQVGRGEFLKRFLKQIGAV